MKELRIISGIFFIVIISSCYYDVEELIYPESECESLEMSLKDDISPILEANCYSCHSSTSRFGGIVLDNYDDLINVAENGVLNGAINHSAGFSPMPQNAAKLLDCEIQKISSWISDGAINN